MLQEGPPDLTKWLPWWAPYLFGLSVFAYQWGKTARERLKKGKTAEVRERDDEIEKALKPLREQLKEANELKELRKEKTDVVDGVVPIVPNRLSSQKNGSCARCGRTSATVVGSTGGDPSAEIPKYRKYA